MYKTIILSILEIYPKIFLLGLVALGKVIF